MPELKPCPFCGVMPTLNESRYAENEYLASVSCRCVNDDIAESYFLRSGKTQVEASAKSISAWNNRPFEDSQRTALIAWLFQAAGAALENQRLLAVLKSVEEIVLEAPELNMSNFDEDQIYSINEAMISICGILLQESARNDLEARNG